MINYSYVSMLCAFELFVVNFTFSTPPVNSVNCQINVKNVAVLLFCAGFSFSHSQVKVNKFLGYLFF